MMSGHFPEDPLRDVDELDLDRLISKAARPIVAFFTAPWCAPCHWIEPEIRDLAAAYGEWLDFVSVDVEAMPILAARYQINCLPAMMLIVRPNLVEQMDRLPELVIGYQTALDLATKLGLNRYLPVGSRREEGQIDLSFPAPSDKLDEIAEPPVGASVPLFNLHTSNNLDDQLITREPGERQAAVRDFHVAFNSTIGSFTAVRDAKLRWRLIDEERAEVIEAIEEGDLAALGGELCDLLYAIYGSAVAFGLLMPDIAMADREGTPALREPDKQTGRINRSVDRALVAIGSEDVERAHKAMFAVLVAAARVEADCGIDLDGFFAEVHRANMSKLGGGMSPDGKAQKPVGWTKPDLEGVLAAQRTAADSQGT
jgi:predicted HAD superfamily Cof-like phosphohydrolase/thiol-disulfide isomerase/thioredoxin